MGTYPVVVVDLSSHNTIESWDAMKAAGVVGVILKSTQGTFYVDKVYAQRKIEAEAAGLKVGCYHFADASDPVKQAQWFLKNSHWDENTLFALDWEDPPRRSDGVAERMKPMSSEQAKVFCEYIYMVTGQRPAIYSGNTAKRELREVKDEFFGQHRLWLASYTQEPHTQESWDTYWLWQFQGDNLGPNYPRQIAGVAGKGIDTNTGDPVKIVAEWTGGRPNKPNTGELPDMDGDSVKPSIGIDDAAVGAGGVGVLCSTDWITAVVVIVIVVTGFVWWKYYRKK